MPRSGIDNGQSVDKKTTLEGESALPKRQEYKEGTSYSPPLSGQASTSESGDMEVKRRNMMYTFVPNWPQGGPKMDALGVLGHSKSVSSPSQAIAGLGRPEHTPSRLDGSLLSGNCLIELMCCADRGRIQST